MLFPVSSPLTEELLRFTLGSTHVNKHISRWHNLQLAITPVFCLRLLGIA